MADVAKRSQAMGSGAPGSRSQPLRDLAPGKRTLVEQAYASKVQRRATEDVGENDGAIRTAASRGIATPSVPIPHRDTIQHAFGRHDISSVQAHTDAQAEQASHALGAVAYASGEHVAFAGAPSLHAAAHEAAHVVQQRGGVQLESGVGRSGDPFEQHADAVADRVVRGESAESLLDIHMHAGRTAPEGVVQRQIFANEEDKKARKPLSSRVLEDKLLNEFCERGYEGEFLEILQSETKHYTVEELRMHLSSLPAKDRQHDAPKQGTPKQTDDQQPIRSMLDDISSESDSSEEDEDEDGEAWTPWPSQPRALPSINAHMGQGVSGDLAQYRLYSGSFSSCVPIVMFNATTSRAGLFHLPQGALDAHKEELLGMVEDVLPTEIRIYKGGYYRDLERSETEGKLGSREREWKEKFETEGESLAEFFTSTLPKVHITNSGDSLGWLTLSITPDRQLKISPGRRHDHAHDLKDRDVPEGARRFQRSDWKYVKAVEF